MAILTPPLLQIFDPVQNWRRQVVQTFGDQGLANVLDYGAKGDGSTDDTAAINAAITAATAAGVSGAMGAIVFFPAGKYKVTSTITLSSPVIIRGSGIGSTLIQPASNSVDPVFLLTTHYCVIEYLQIMMDLVNTPTLTCIQEDTGTGLNWINNVYLFGNAGGTGIKVVQANASRYTNLRIQNVTTGIITGGTTAKFCGDLVWTELVIIPTSSGTGWIMDGNTDAQYMQRIEIIGGTNCLILRGSGASTNELEGIFVSDSNIDAASSDVVQILSGNTIIFADTNISGSTGGHGVYISGASSSAVDGVIFDNCIIRGNWKRGISFEEGANLTVRTGECYSNSNAGSGTYANIYVGASAVGLVMVVGVMAGVSKTGELFANSQAPSSYGVELAALSLTDVTNFKGRLVITSNMLQGNTTGAILDNSAPGAGQKLVANNLT